MRWISMECRHQLAVVRILAVLVSLVLAVAAANPARADSIADAAHAAMEDMPVEACLACHGPFETLREKTQDWVAPSGIRVNPHITFDRDNPVNPHASGEGLTPCTECHVPHPVPLVEPLPEAGIDSCIACHHTGTFRTCTECH